MSEVELVEYHVTQKTYLRDDSGRFLAAVHAGAAAAAWEMADTLAALAIANAPVRSGGLVGSIRAFMVTATQGVAVADAPHAAPQEKSAVPHWIPNAFGRNVAVWHPGNPATRFMEHAGRAVAALSGMIVKRHMPG